MLKTTMAALVLLACGSAAAQQAQPWSQEPTTGPASSSPTLTVGSRAPELSIQKWIKGDPITGFEKGRVYVVEFWASWCQPCQAAMPHLTALQKEFAKKGVTILGVSGADPNNTLADVEQLIADKGALAGYTIAWDDGPSTRASWMAASGQSAIPCSFVVDKNGSIAFIGHPMWLTEVLPKVVKGSWNNDTDNDQIDVSNALVNEAWRLSRTDPKGALEKLKQVESRHSRLPQSLSEMKFNLLLKAGDYSKASSLGSRLVSDAITARDSSSLNEIAWTIVDPEGAVEKKDLGLALKAAESACEFTAWKEPHVLDTLARVYFLKGDVKKAIEVQTNAIALASPDMKEQFTPALEEYQRALANRK